MRLPRHLPRGETLKIAALALVFIALIVFDIAMPLTPVEQQALVGVVIVLGVIAMWLV